MAALRNVLALIGLLALMAGSYAYLKYKPIYDAYRPMLTEVRQIGPEKMKSMMESWDIPALIRLGDELDPRAPEVYKTMLERLIETKNSADATVWKVPVEEGLSVEDVEASMKTIANEHNIKNVGELPLSEQVRLMTDEEQRFLKIYMFCNPLTAMNMVQHSDAYSAYLPCRISLIEDKEGKLWLYALDMDMMIWGGATLPDYLQEEALSVRSIIKDIMERAAEGDF